jgi:hypothetical protein
MHAKNSTTVRPLSVMQHCISILSGWYEQLQEETFGVLRHQSSSRSAF